MVSCLSAQAGARAFARGAQSVAHFNAWINVVNSFSICAKIKVAACRLPAYEAAKFEAGVSPINR